MRIQSVNILLDFSTPFASEDIVENSPNYQNYPEDNQVIQKPEKQESSSSSSQLEEEEKEHPIQFAESEGKILSADVVDTTKNQSAKYNIDCIVNIKGQAHKIRPMSPRSYRRWSRNCSSGLVMHRLNESYSSLDEKDSWKEISQKAQSSNQEDAKIEKVCKFEFVQNLTY